MQNRIRVGFVSSSCQLGVEIVPMIMSQRSAVSLSILADGGEPVAEICKIMNKVPTTRLDLTCKAAGVT